MTVAWDSELHEIADAWMRLVALQEAIFGSVVRNSTGTLKIQFARYASNHCYQKIAGLALLLSNLRGGISDRRYVISNCGR
jgi:hypothetical protein